MKTLVFVACLFAMTYAAPEKLKELFDNLGNCAKELNKSPTDPEVVYCGLKKDGKIDENGLYLMEKNLEFVDEVISDEADRNKAKEIIQKCYDEVDYGHVTPENINEKTLKGIQCGIGVFDILYKQ